MYKPRQSEASSLFIYVNAIMRKYRKKLIQLDDDRTAMLLRISRETLKAFQQNLHMESQIKCYGSQTSNKSTYVMRDEVILAKIFPEAAV